MLYYAIKIVISALLITLISEISKRSSLFGSLTASLPLVSILSMIWLYQETKDTAQISSLSTGIFWLVLPSLVFFIILPFFLKKGYNFYISLTVSIFIMLLFYFGMLAILSKFNIKL